MRQMYAILVSVENEGDFITTSEKTAKKGYRVSFDQFEGNKEKIQNYEKKTKKQRGCRKYDFVTVKV